MVSMDMRKQKSPADDYILIYKARGISTRQAVLVRVSDYSDYRRGLSIWEVARLGMNLGNRVKIHFQQMYVTFRPATVKWRTIS